MKDLIFIVHRTSDGGYRARALGESIFSEADDLESLHWQIQDAVLCHFEDGQAPKTIHLHFADERSSD